MSAAGPVTKVLSDRAPHAGRRSPRPVRAARIAPVNWLVWALLALYLLPIAFMVVTACMPTEQLADPDAPLYPARKITFEYENRIYPVYQVPTADGMHQWALVERGDSINQFVDPQDPESGRIAWQGDWRTLAGVYEFSISWENFAYLIEGLPLGRMLGVTLLITLVSGCGVLASSVVVAYGFSRFPIPGGNPLFYLLIAVIMVPDSVTFFPTYFLIVNRLHWQGTLYPVVVPYFFGSAVYIFLLRQNSLTLPMDLEEAAMIDGAGPLRRLFSVILPQSWPVVITVAILHFFFVWNETKQVSLYTSGNPLLMPLSYGMQYYSGNLTPNIIEASTLITLILPVVVLLLSQRIFLQSMRITGAESE
jgi:multiple sugar transport system permease protein